MIRQSKKGIVAVPVATVFFASNFIRMLWVSYVIGTMVESTKILESTGSDEFTLPLTTSMSSTPFITYLNTRHCFSS